MNRSPRSAAVAIPSTNQQLSVFLLVVAPALVLLVGAYMASKASTVDLGSSFLSSLGGLFLCVGALLVYGVLFARKAAVVERIFEPKELRRFTVSQHARLHQLAIYFGGFAVAGIVYGLVGVAEVVVMQTLVVLFGMVYLTLVAHFHAHRTTL